MLAQLPKAAILLPALLVLSCAGAPSDEQLRSKKSEPYRWVGDIQQDANLDDPDFKVCNGDENVAQYFHSGKSLDISGEHTAIYQAFQQQYKPINVNQSGLIRIRFIVNCKGMAGRFRLTASDENYQETSFDPAITDQLLAISKGLQGWGVQENEYGQLDYYQYLLFVVEKGEIKEILP